MNEDIMKMTAPRQTKVPPLTTVPVLPQQTTSPLQHKLEPVWSASVGNAYILRVGATIWADTFADTLGPNRMRVASWTSLKFPWEVLGVLCPSDTSVAAPAPSASGQVAMFVS